MIKKVYLFIFFLILNHTAFNQARRFTPEPEKFLKEMQSCIAEVDKSKAKLFIKSFESIWLRIALQMPNLLQVSIKLIPLLMA